MSSSSGDQEPQASLSDKRTNVHAHNNTQSKKQALCKLQAKHVDSSDDSAHASEASDSESEERHAGTTTCSQS